MSKQSAGILAFRRTPELQFLLVHPGGPFWAKKDEGAWSIPKGEFEGDEDPREAAKREFQEETGHEITTSLIELTPVTQAGGKRIQAWATETDLDPDAITSNEFEMEWPPKSGKMQAFPEVDKAAWFTLDEAMIKINKAQIPFLEELASK